MFFTMTKEDALYEAWVKSLNYIEYVELTKEFNTESVSVPEFNEYLNSMG